ncbi:hypothetical protein DOY81_005606 [Sarcophaga bullata]|nr:hypothetical protein DOY81_005606 [Sarcophaga bullata]
MPPIKYTATISPNTIQSGDKIRIKGILMDGAKEFSVNFVNEICRNPAFITYHFKWIIDENVIVENYKDNGKWIAHKEKQNDQLDGTIFDVEFTFQDGYIDVYKFYQDLPNLISTYETQLNISDIQGLQVWGDVMKITEVSFKYP